MKNLYETDPEFAERLDMSVIAIADPIEDRRRNESMVERDAAAKLPTKCSSTFGT